MFGTFSWEKWRQENNFHGISLSKKRFANFADQSGLFYWIIALHFKGKLALHDKAISK